MDKKYYVLGFLFSPDCKRVALIIKNRPDWQAGFLNGIGGKIEESDHHALEAMIREFKEETGVLVDSWKFYAEMKGKEWVVYCYTAFSNDIDKVKTMTDEKVIIVETNELYKLSILDNLKFLIPMALNDANFYATINYD